LSAGDYGQIRDRLRASYDEAAERRDRRDKQPWKLSDREKFAARLRAEGLTRRLETGAAKGLDARQMDFSRLDFPPESFDAVPAMNCLLHVPNAELPPVLAEIARVLRRGGLFFLGVYGGCAEEGPLAGDDHVPARFFAFRTDEQIVSYASQCFEVVDFHLVRHDGQHVFRSLTLRRP
jgi:SAM-dependent methyltransferase